jgi:hypothetical protein
MTNSLTTRRQIDEWIKHPLTRVVLQWMAANRSELREVDAKFQAALASAPQEIPANFRRLAAGHDHAFYEGAPPAFHSAGALIEAAMARYSAITGDVARDEPDLGDLHLVLSPSTVSALSGAHPRPALADGPDARLESD